MFMKTIRQITSRGSVFLVALFLSALAVSSCEEDPNEMAQEIIIYKLLCPSGLTACYQSCEQKVGNGDDIVQVEEKEDYESCAGVCDINCDTSFLYLMSN